MLRLSLCLITLMMACVGHAGETPKCTSQIPVQITEVGKSAPWPNKSYDSEPYVRSEQSFRSSVTKITEHVSAWLAKEQLCLNNADSRKPSLLTFEKWPDLIAEDEPLTLPPSVDERPSGDCRIASPWIDIAVERKPSIRIHSVVRWNPRQVIVDQAILYGMSNLPPGVAMPLRVDEFNLQAKNYEYRSSKYWGPRDSEWAKRFDVPMPPDLFWLFQNSSPFGEKFPLAGQARGRWQLAIVDSEDRFTNLVIAVIDHCVATEGVEMNLQSILDAADLISIEKYKVPLGHGQY